MFDLALIRKWLYRDYQLNKSYKQNKSDDKVLDDMRENLKVCYRNKGLLQRLVYETSLI